MKKWGKKFKNGWDAETRGEGEISTTTTGTPRTAATVETSTGARHFFFCLLLIEGVCVSFCMRWAQGTGASVMIAATEAMTMESGSLEEQARMKKTRTLQSSTTTKRVQPFR